MIFQVNRGVENLKNYIMATGQLDIYSWENVPTYKTNLMQKIPCTKYLKRKAYIQEMYKQIQEISNDFQI